MHGNEIHKIYIFPFGNILETPNSNTQINSKITMRKKNDKKSQAAEQCNKNNTYQVFKSKSLFINIIYGNNSTS